MKRIIFLIGAAMLCASFAAATDWSTMETFLGYNFVRFNPNSGYVPSFNANGGSGQFVYNFTSSLGAVVDVGAVNKGVLNHADFNTTVMDFVAGPRYTFRHDSRFMPFAQVLFGGAFGTTSTPITPLEGPLPSGIDPSRVEARLSASGTNFAMMAGGGLDIKISKHIAFRPVEADYYLARVSSLLTGNTSNRNNFRYAAGVNFLFGAK